MWNSCPGPITIAELSKETKKIASDDREENMTARLSVTIVNSAKDHCESVTWPSCSDSAFELLNSAMSVLGRLPVDKSLPNEYRSDLRRRSIPEREEMRVRIRLS